MGGIITMSSISKLRKVGGFSLTEVMITIVILGMIGITLTSLISHTLKGWSSGSSRNNADNAVDVLLHKFYVDIRTGSSATIVNGELQLSVPPVITDAYGEKYCEPSATPTVYKYKLENGLVYRKIGSDESKVFARDISSITFSVTGDVVRITVTGRNKVGMYQSERQGTAKVAMRNYQKQG